MRSPPVRFHGKGRTSHVFNGMWGESMSMRFRPVSKIASIIVVMCTHIAFFLLQGHLTADFAVSFVVGTLLAGYLTFKEARVREVLAYVLIGWLGSILACVLLPNGYLHAHPAVDATVVAAFTISVGMPVLFMLNWAGAILFEKFMPRRL